MYCKCPSRSKPSSEASSGRLWQKRTNQEAMISNNTASGAVARLKHQPQRRRTKRIRDRHGDFVFPRVKKLRHIARVRLFPIAPAQNQIVERLSVNAHDSVSESANGKPRRRGRRRQGERAAE